MGRARLIAAVSVVAFGLGMVLEMSGDRPPDLDGTIAAGGLASVGVRPDEPADFTAYVLNRGPGAVILQSAQLLPLPGFAEPNLVHLAVESGGGVIGAGRGWPVHGRGFGIRPFVGTRVPPGRRVQILYAVSALQLGNYADLGLSVQASSAGGTVTVRALAAGGACVRVNGDDHGCSDTFDNNASTASGAIHS